MPGSTTEVLNDGLKELRTDLHRVETTLATAVGKLAAEFGLFKWLVGASLVASVSGVVSSAYWAGSLASRVTALEGRADKVDSQLDRIEISIPKVASRTEGAGASTPEKQ